MLFEVQCIYKIVYTSYLIHSNIECMRWVNGAWAVQHLAKRHPEVSIQDAWEAAFEDADAVPICSADQLRFPPMRRYFTIGKTKVGKELFVVWEVYKGKHLITAYPPDEARRKVYETAKRATPGTKRQNR